ncbi:acyl transferase/acyl hydrolase/lysophospholipase [Xylariomycetidae sp. FL2044]|nr:acyl transferase/acyl hydrolase/lysophospholipase [Xylariomycetidae sp. FL2044]
MIRPCFYWLWTSGDETLTIAGSDRLRQLTSSLPPRGPAPNLLLWIGCRRRPAITSLEERPLGRTSCSKPARENHPSAFPKDLDIVAAHVASWIEGEDAPRSEYPPRFLVIMAGYRWKEWTEPAAMQKFHALVREKTTPPLDSFFPETLFLRIHYGEHVRSVRQRRRDAHALFMGPHLGALFDRAQDFPVSPSMATHLANFVNHIPSAPRLQDFAAPVIASSILPDQYPPETHRNILCQSPIDLSVRVRPLTAGHGILCIGGGGVGGMIPSTVLELVEDALGLPIPVQDHFTLAYGVSVSWSAATCTAQLQTMAEDAFHSPARGFVLFFLLLTWTHILLFSCLYSAWGIETALTTTKVGVLAATSIKQPKTYLFTNYNGIGDARVGYDVHPGSHTVQTREVYFPPKHIPGLGDFVDGGIVRNNPTVIGLWEFRTIGLGAKPDLVVNLSTGSSSDYYDVASRRPQVLRRYGWLPRLIRAYLSHLQGQRTWNDVTGLVKKEPRTHGYYRLDIALQGKVGLDDTAAMPRLRSLTLQDTVLRDTISQLARRLFAALFYFELTAVPTQSGSRFRIHGRIACSVRDAWRPGILAEALREKTSYGVPSEERALAALQHNILRDGLETIYQRWAVGLEQFIATPNHSMSGSSRPESTRDSSKMTRFSSNTGGS